MEDWKKKYEDAIIGINAVYENADAATKAALEIKFPELVESEDERIRKQIIKFIKVNKPDYSDWKDYSSWVDWLEKQKINTDGDFARGYDCGYECCLYSHGAEWFEKQKEFLHIPETCKENANSFTDEDERIRKKCIELIKRVIPSGNNQSSESKDILDCIAYIEKQKEQKPVDIKINNPNVQKFDPTVKITTSDSSANGKELLYVCNKSYDIGFRDGVASVKLAEWSEDDEEFFETALWDISYSISNRMSTDYHCDTTDWLKGIKERLKSLRPQPYWKPSEEELVTLKRVGCVLRDCGHSELAKEVFMIEGKLANLSVVNKSTWKPSEEQMEALKYALGKGGIYNKEALKSLLDDLKKLM